MTKYAESVEEGPAKGDVTSSFTEQENISKTIMTDNAVPSETLYSIFTKHQRWWIVFLAAVAGWFSTLSSFIYFPAIPVISKDLHTSIEKINLTVMSYLLVSAFVPSVVGKAADTHGRRPVYVVTLAAYLVANIGLALQSTFPALFVPRMIAAAGIQAASLYLKALLNTRKLVQN